MTKSITCPRCKAEIKLDDALVGPIQEKLEGEYKERLARQLEQLAGEAKKKAADDVSIELRDLEARLDEQRRKADESVANELELRRKVRTAEQREEDLKLELERKLDVERRRIAEEISSRTAEEHRLKDREKDLQMDGLKRQVEDLRKKLEQGSQQLQGEAQEQELEQVLRAAFPGDEIVPIKTGQRGADLLHRVRDGAGRDCGSILWESKRVANFSAAWIPKLKGDQREQKADLGALVSTALPEEIKQLGPIDGVWVCGFGLFRGLAAALRETLLATAQARRSLNGKKERMEVLYSYLCGPQFRGRVEAIIEGFRELKDELDSEKRATQTRWARREKQLEKVLLNTAGMYGDLQGIAALPQIKSLELPMDDGGEPPKN